MTEENKVRIENAIRIIRENQTSVNASQEEDEISKAESELGVKFPTSYKEFIKALGTSGWPEFIYGLGKNILPGSSVVWTTQRERHDVEPAMPHNLIPISPDGWGNHYCLDTNQFVGDECPVVFWNHELGQNQEPEFVNTDFLEWLEAAIAAKLASDAIESSKVQLE
jgi:hypothetical protein